MAKSLLGLLAVLPIGAVALLLTKKTAGSTPASRDDIDPNEPIGMRVARALDTLDVGVIRREAARLRKEGQAFWADTLEKAIPLVEKMKAQKKEWPDTADGVLEPYLLNPPVPSDEDRLVDSWMVAADNGGPPLVALDTTLQQAGASRYLTPRERWLLAPHFPVAEDLGLELVFAPPKEIPAELIDPRMWAVTIKRSTDTVARVYFPQGPRLLLSRWWLCVLGHELIHGAQIRIGMTPAEVTDSYLSYGYQLSPPEVQARAFQRAMWLDFAKRAKAWKAKRR